MTLTEADLTAADIAWDLEPLLGDVSVDELLDRADGLADELVALRGRVAELGVDELVPAMERMAGLHEAVSRAGNYASLRFATDTNDPERGALMARVQERGTAISTK